MSSLKGDFWGRPMQVTLGLLQFLCHWILHQHRMFPTTWVHAWLSWYLCDRRPVSLCVCPVHAGKAAWLLLWHLSCPWIEVVYLVIERRHESTKQKKKKKSSLLEEIFPTKSSIIDFLKVLCGCVYSQLSLLHLALFVRREYFSRSVFDLSKEGISIVCAESITKREFTCS